MYEFLRIRKAKLKLQFVGSPAVRFTSGVTARATPTCSLPSGLNNKGLCSKGKLLGAQLDAVRETILHLKIKS